MYTTHIFTDTCTYIHMNIYMHTQVHYPHHHKHFYPHTHENVYAHTCTLHNLHRLLYLHICKHAYAHTCTLYTNIDTQIKCLKEGKQGHHKSVYHMRQVFISLSPNFPFISRRLCLYHSLPACQSI